MKSAHFLYTALVYALCTPALTFAQTADVVVYASTGRTAGNWSVLADTTAAGGARLANADKGAAKLTTALASPVDYFEVDFQATAGVAYRLWLRGNAAKNSYSNDSAFVQFSDSVDATGAPRFRIGTTSATVFTVEDCSGCGVSGWGWNDNFYGSTPGDPIYFATTGVHTVRVQIREDGLSLDQIVLSPVTYWSQAPGAAKNDSVILTPSSTTTVEPASTTPPADPSPTPDPTSPTPEPTSPTPDPSVSGEVVLYAAKAITYGKWNVATDASAAGGARISNPDRKAAKLANALAAPADYFELTFTASAGIPYALWIRGSAAKNSYLNDSVFVQFSDSVTAAGLSSFRIGTTAATMYTLEDCSGCGTAGWGWNDTVYGPGSAEPIYFATSGQHTIRVQVREDGLSIDQIVLSPAAFLTTSPGALKNDTVILPASDGSSAATPPPPAANLPPVLETGEDGFRIASLEGAMNAPATLLFTASATGPESSDTLTYTWNFGDGSLPETYVQTAEASRQNAVHTYTTGGIYTVTVRISDQAGNSTETSGTVTVGPGQVLDPATTLKVVQWNVYKGRSTDTRTEQSKIWLQSRWIAAANPDVVVLQEVMGSAMAEKYRAELERLLPQTTWTYLFKTDAATNSTSAEGIAILTRHAIQHTASIAYEPCPNASIVQRSAVATTLRVNGRDIVVVGTHLSSYTSDADMACRTAQAQQLITWAETLGTTRIVAGDLNADPLEDAMAAHLLPAYADTWDDVAHRTAYADNPTATLITRSERIDYVLTSRDGTLELVAVQVPDIRDVTNDNPIATQGQTLFAPLNYAPRASDHELMIATFVVR